MSEYSDKVDALANSFLESATPGRFALLAEHIGCSYILYGSQNKEAFFPEQPEAVNEAVARKTLLRLLEKNVPHGYLPTLASGVLSGVVKQGRWTECLTTLEGGYALATSLIQWVAVPTDTQVPTKRGNDLYERMSADVLAVLNEWLKPETPWNEPPTRNALVSAFFGPAWCAIMEVSAMPTREVLRLIYSARPPFDSRLLPGLGQVSAPLPDFL